MSSSVERVLAAALMLAAAGARADVFSPGPLAQSHANLEGLTNCTKCHVAGGKLSNDTCLVCHKTTRQDITKHRGIHGRLPPAEDRKSTRLNSSHVAISYAVFRLK